MAPNGGFVFPSSLTPQQRSDLSALAASTYSFLSGNPDLMTIFMDFSGLSSSQVLEMFTDGSGPKLGLGNFSGENPPFAETNQKGNIRINKSDFYGDEVNNHGWVVTLLHEGVHSGDARTRSKGSRLDGSSGLTKGASGRVYTPSKQISFTQTGHSTSIDGRKDFYKNKVEAGYAFESEAFLNFMYRLNRKTDLSNPNKNIHRNNIPSQNHERVPWLKNKDRP